MKELGLFFPNFLKHIFTAEFTIGFLLGLIVGVYFFISYKDKEFKRLKDEKQSEVQRLNDEIKRTLEEKYKQEERSTKEIERKDREIKSLKE